jgi:hypothetical protein
VIAAAILAGVEWTRTWGFGALALPIAVWLLARRPDRPVAVATGTLALWERVRAARPSASPRARSRVPPAVWLLIASLTLGALALAGPRSPERRPVALRVLVDASPSMGLSLGSGTRRDRALELARQWIDTQVPRGSTATWIDHPGSFGPIDDREGVLWVTDRAPDDPPKLAGCVASGGEAVPGPIAVDGATRYDWDGERIVEVPGGAPSRRLVVDGTLPAPIAGVLGAWAEARGAVLDSGAGTAASLTIRTVPRADARELEVARDGWKSRASAAGTVRAGTTWLADGAGGALVAFDRGRIENALVAMREPEGDPAAFAVSWARLLDEVVLPPPGVVELGERRAVGAEEMRMPPPSDSSEDAGTRRSWAPWLAFASAGLAACAAGLARSGRIE